MKKTRRKLFQDERPPRIVTPEAQVQSEAANLHVLLDQFEELRAIYEKAKQAYWSLRTAAGIPRDVKHPQAVSLLEARQ